MQKFFLPQFALLVVFLLSACAGSHNADSAKNFMGDSGCSECGEQGKLDLEISSESGFVEINPDAVKILDPKAIFGSFPAQNIVAECPEGNKLCHSFSNDAVDFDLAHFEDSLIAERFPKMTHEQMLVGLRIPDEDSAFIAQTMQSILQAKFVEGKTVADLSPWKERADSSISYSAFARFVPKNLKRNLYEVYKHYNVRYVSIPVTVQVKIFPKLGRSGGFTWKSLWTLWDARLGELVLLSYNEFTAETTSRIAPERGWAKPFAERLGNALNCDPQAIENH